MRLATVLRTLSLLLALGGCGKGDPDGPTPTVSPADATRARLEAVFAAAREDDPGAVLPLLGIREDGADGRRVYRQGRNDTADRARVGSVRRRILGHLDLGVPRFVSSESREKPGETWVAWHVAFGDAADAPRALYAFVSDGGPWWLADIDG